MTRITVMTLHGINVTTPQYSMRLLDMLDTPRVCGEIVNWSAPVLDYIREWRGFHSAPTAPTWNPIRAWKRYLKQEAHQSAVWVQGYEFAKPRVGNIFNAALTRALSHGEQVLFVAHSLGTVVLLDQLTAAIRAKSITVDRIRGIVTMGSPLAYWRGPNALAGLIKASGLDRTAWLNVLDPDDMVAAALGTLGIEGLRDVEINTGWLLRAHVNYWKSKEVAAIVKALIEKDCE